LECRVRGDASAEMWATERKSDLFQEAFRRALILRTRQAAGRTPSVRRPAASADAPLWQRMREIAGLAARP
jgi:hypothetical protein